MPIYGYRCTDCGHEMEVHQSMSDAPLLQCPQCAGPLRKMIYPVGVRFKGSGFYTTDYRNGTRSGESGSKTSSGDASESQGSSGKPAAKSDSKTDSKIDSKGD